MPSFYECGQCKREFLGHEDIPIHDEGVVPICERCDYRYVCGICGDFFYPVVHETIEGAIFEGQADYCASCYARECMPVEEEMALSH